jgi:hypothetical protein
MEIIEIILLFIFSLIQSIFGVGVLLFGTPTFLLLGYDYFETLNIILPWSLIISLLQILAFKKNNYKFFILITKFSLPSLMFTSIFILTFENKINFNFIVSFFLIIFSLINLFKNKIIIKKIEFSLFTLGIIHGLTNLGGSLLSLICSNIDNKKYIVRHNIAIGYFIFSIFQLIVINYFKFNSLSIEFKYLWIPILAFFISQKVFFQIKDLYFNYTINLLMFFYGLYIFYFSVI